MERRYNDKEIAAIFRAASEGPETQQRSVAPDEGMTLPELQAIGREVGLAPDAVAQAARALDVRRPSTAPNFLGVPLGVSRTVDLGRRLNDEEWERLVVQLRDVFDARGVMKSEGSFRQWTNGNLQVLLEPTATGHQLRFRTVHGAARAQIGAGLMTIALGGLVFIAGTFATRPINSVAGAVVLALGGALFVVAGVLRLPRWAKIRAQQMDALAAQVTSPSTEPRPQ